jgi:PAS domain S-box-containing protein
VTLERHLDDRELPDAVREALRSGAVGALVCDASRIHEANDHFLRLVGFGRDDLEAGSLSWLRMTDPQWLAEDARAIGQLRATGRADAYEKSFIGRDGAEVPVRLADLLLEVEPLRIFVFVARPDDDAARGVVDAVDAATRR